ncbi:lipoate--protein ligase family protein [Candidatus Woesearchaeota archaeon]|nr:lipoate--protein ligase family protein [Candidatus Woesearchaeota archaeon]
MRFRLIDTGYNTPSMNMAIDEALLSSKLPVLRFYRWSPPGLSIGHFQPISSFDLEALKKNNISMVRRMTGGNAVLHDDELTYSFITEESRMPKGIVESYREISRALLHGLKALGLDAVMNEDVEKGEKSQVCFNDPSWYEILVDGKKIVGSAQKRVGGKLLQHGAVLIGIDIRKYCSLFKSFSPGLLKKAASRMTSINDGLQEKVDYEKVRQSMVEGFKKVHNIEFIEDSLAKKELESAEALEKKKYSSEGWNFKF